MRAIRVHEFGGPEVLKLEEVADPRPGPGQVLVRVRAAGVNPVETYIRAGAYAMLPELRYTPGGDAGGVVEALGEGVDDLTAGDRVYVAEASNAGTYAELVVAGRSRVHPLPGDVSFPQAAAVGVPYGTAYRGLFHKAEARAGQNVLVHGASGAVGIAAVQLACAQGMRVIGTAGTERGRQLVAEQGADVVVDHTDAGYLDAIRDATGGAGPDVILEMLANVNLQSDLALAARFGHVVVIGNRGTIEIDPRLTMGKDLTVRGMALWNCPPEELRSIHAALGAGLANGTLHPVVGRELPLAEAPDAHVKVLEPGAYGKIVLVP